MRRAALRGCALLLRSSASASGAAGEPAALLAAGLQAATAAVACGRLLWAAWPQAPFRAAAPLGQQADDDSGGTSGEEQPQFVKHFNAGKRSKLLPVRSELAGELQPLAALAGVADAAALALKVAALGPTRERGVLQHGAAVAQLLISLGVSRAQLAALLHRCPYLFSWPADERPALLFGQLARLGLSAAEAARCFEKQPMAAGSVSFEPAIAVLAPLFADAGSKAGSGKTGEQLLGHLLRRVPAAVGLLEHQLSTLQQRIDSLVQRYGPHWEQQNKHAVIVTALQQNWVLLTRPPEHLLALEAVLQRELGQQPGDGTRLLATIVYRQTRAASASPGTLRQRAQALLAEFGLERLLQAGPGSLAELLAVDTAAWQRALAVWRLLGVADPAALGLRNTQPLTLDWLRPDLLARLAALQRLLPWQPAAADVVQHFSGYVSAYAPHRLIGRLLFLQQEGALPLLVANKPAAKQQWQQRGLRATMGAQAEPQLLSLCDIAVLPDAKLCALLAQAQAAQPEQPGSGNASSGSSTGGSNVAERYQAFLARLPQLPAYQQLLAAGEAESRRLAALLPPKLRLVAGKPGQQPAEAQGGPCEAQ